MSTLRRAGIDNISCDLIYGLPGQTPASFARSIDRLLEIGPPHISAYLLSYEPGTRLTRDLEAGRISRASDTEACNYYHQLCDALSAAGYIHYEISNFALPGMHSRHNSSYWDPDSAYLGLGPSAHSYDGICRRRANIASIGRYLSSPADAADPELTETLSESQLFDERLMLGPVLWRGSTPPHPSSLSTQCCAVPANGLKRAICISATVCSQSTLPHGSSPTPFWLTSLPTDRSKKWLKYPLRLGALLALAQISLTL